jgi:hypothetical protein
LNESRKQLREQRNIDLLSLREKLGLLESHSARETFLHYLKTGVTGETGNSIIAQNAFNYLVDLSLAYGPEIQGLKNLDRNWNIFRTNTSNCPTMPINLSQFDDLVKYGLKNLAFCHVTMEIGLFTTFNPERPSNLFQSNGQPFCAGCFYRNKKWITPINASIKNNFQARYSPNELNLIMFQDFPDKEYIPQWDHLYNIPIRKRYPIGPSFKGSLISSEIYTNFQPVGNRGALNDVIHSVQSIPPDVLLLALGNKETKAQGPESWNESWLHPDNLFAENTYSL